MFTRAEIPLFSIASLLEQIILDFCSVVRIRTKLLIKVGKHAPEKSILRFRLRYTSHCLPREAQWQNLRR
jgi:hypothetical protein